MGGQGNPRSKLQLFAGLRATAAHAPTVVRAKESSGQSTSVAKGIGSKQTCYRGVLFKLHLRGVVSWETWRKSSCSSFHRKISTKREQNAPLQHCQQFGPQQSFDFVCEGQHRETGFILVSPGTLDDSAVSVNVSAMSKGVMTSQQPSLQGVRKKKKAHFDCVLAMSVASWLRKRKKVQTTL